MPHRAKTKRIKITDSKENHRTKLRPGVLLGGCKGAQTISPMLSSPVCQQDLSEQSNNHKGDTGQKQS